MERIPRHFVEQVLRDIKRQPELNSEQLAFMPCGIDEAGIINQHAVGLACNLPRDGAHYIEHTHGCDLDKRIVAVQRALLERIGRRYEQNWVRGHEHHERHYTYEHFVLGDPCPETLVGDLNREVSSLLKLAPDSPEYRAFSAMCDENFDKQRTNGNVVFVDFKARVTRSLPPENGR